MSQATAAGARMCQAYGLPSICKKLPVAGFVGGKQILEHIL